MCTSAGWCEGPPLIRELKPNLSGFGFLFCFTNVGKGNLSRCRTASWLSCPTAMMTVHTAASLALGVDILVSIRIHKLAEKESKYWRINFVFQTGKGIYLFATTRRPTVGCTHRRLRESDTYPVAPNLRQCGTVSHLPYYFMTWKLIRNSSWSFYIS